MGRGSSLISLSVVCLSSTLCFSYILLGNIINLNAWLNQGFFFYRFSLIHAHGRNTKLTLAKYITTTQKQKSQHGQFPKNWLSSKVQQYCTLSLHTLFKTNYFNSPLRYYTYLLFFQSLLSKSRKRKGKC